MADMRLVVVERCELQEGSTPYLRVADGTTTWITAERSAAPAVSRALDAERALPQEVDPDLDQLIMAP